MENEMNPEVLKMSDEAKAVRDDSGRLLFEVAKRVATALNADLLANGVSLDSEHLATVLETPWESLSEEQRFVWVMNMVTPLGMVLKMFSQFGDWVNGEYEPPAVPEGMSVADMLAAVIGEAGAEAPGNYL